jgi:fructose-1,6-bisphosphatase/inositol monophosphatase family enzyme
MPSNPGQSKLKSARLCDRITTTKDWATLHQVAIQAATTGGLAAMGFYRQALSWPTGLTTADEEDKNPSTIADLQATSRILQTIHTMMAPIAHRLKCEHSYLAEETRYVPWFRQNLSSDIFKGVKSPPDFFIEHENALRVIVDGIDGTGSFIRGLPLFCSAVAILVDDQARVSAIYDPIHHIVYSAFLAGPYENPLTYTEAWAWQVATGGRIDLTERATGETAKPLHEEAIGIHLTRNQRNRPRRQAFLGIHPPDTSSMLERLADASGAIYAQNSGIVAMADVARGALGGFVNIVTNLWDVAAGAVLVRACGGKVTDFNDRPIEYASTEQVSVVAAKGHLHSQILQVLAGER